MRRSVLKKVTWWLIGAALVAAILVWILHIKITTFRLGLVPATWGVSEVLYAKDESSGFGPGGNESGIVVYRLPNAIATQLQNRGITAEALSAKPDDERPDWAETPVSDMDWRCEPVVVCAAPGRPMVENYLDRYGFGISIPKDLANELNSAISKPGAYYSHGRIGVLIVAPSVGKVYFVFSG